MRSKSLKKEESLQLSVCRYIKLQYPDVIFMTDTAAGMRLTIGQAVKAKNMRSSRGLPDLFIAEARDGKFGLFIELKKEGIKIIKRNGDWIDDHAKEQAEIIVALRNKGYVADFAFGFDHAKTQIDKYFGK